MLVIESVIHERRTGPGDLVFVVGLFTRMTGKRRSNGTAFPRFYENAVQSIP
jgi:hypothetical protein